jgi:predicted AAA+ superfamily ATPase
LNQLPLKDVFYISFCQIDEGQVPLYALEGIGIRFEPTVPLEIARRLQLSYYPDGNNQTEMCYINSPEVRSEFKVSFTLQDLSDYLNATLSSATYQEQLKNTSSAQTVVVPFLTDLDEFWGLVEAGSRLRHKMTY